MNITLALGGGGAKGNSHIGVIRRLEKEGFKINAVAGTSFGGIIAVFYALGHSPDEIEYMFSVPDQSKLYGHLAEEEPSLLGLAGATRWLEHTLASRTFADLKIPCVLTAADLKTGNEVTLSEGSLVNALLATIAVPGIFPARRMGDYELVDGSMLNPVPVIPARLLAPELPVIAVALNAPMGVPERAWAFPLPEYIPRNILGRLSRLRSTQALDVFLRSMGMITRAITEYRLEVDKPDIILRPEVADIDILTRVDIHQVAQIGEKAVEDALPELKKLFAWQYRFRRVIGV